MPPPRPPPIPELALYFEKTGGALKPFPAIPYPNALPLLYDEFLLIPLELESPGSAGDAAFGRLY